MNSISPKSSREQSRNTRSRCQSGRMLANQLSSRPSLHSSIMKKSSSLHKKNPSEHKNIHHSSVISTDKKFPMQMLTGRASHHTNALSTNNYEVMTYQSQTPSQYNHGFYRQNDNLSALEWNSQHRMSKDLANTTPFLQASAYS